MLRRLTAASVCSPIASSAHIHCRDTRQTAHAVADATFSKAHAGASDALALVTIARCISLKQIVSRCAFRSHDTVPNLAEEQFHCFDAVTVSGSLPLSMSGLMSSQNDPTDMSTLNLIIFRTSKMISYKQNSHWGFPFKIKESRIGIFLIALWLDLPRA